MKTDRLNVMLIISLLAFISTVMAYGQGGTISSSKDGNLTNLLKCAENGHPKVPDLLQDIENDELEIIQG